MDMVKELVGDLEASSSEVASLMHELDESSAGEVSWDEFLAVMQRMHTGGDGAPRCRAGGWRGTRPTAGVGPRPRREGARA